jgi:hypothetical protein
MLSDYSQKANNPSHRGLSSYRSQQPARGLSRGLSSYSPQQQKLDTSEGLYNLAVQSGLKEQADRVLSEKGEETKKIFSGGFISDIFDGLNALQYGIVGMLKGKSFKEGVETRQSWSDKDALGNFGIPGMIGGIALDIACDPFTYVAPWTILKKVGVTKKLGKATKVAQNTKLGQWLSKALVYRFGQDPIYRLFDERRIKNIAVGQKNIQKLIDPFIKIPAKKADKLITRTKGGSFIRTPLNKLKNVLTEDEMWNVSKAYSLLDDMGKQAVDLNLLSKKTWEKNMGEYIKNAYEEYELATKGKGLFDWAKRGIKGIKKRKPLSLAKRKELGEIKNPAYLMAKSMLDLNVDIENTKLFNMVAKKIGRETAEEGFEKLPTTRRLFTTATGQKVEMLTKIKNLNKELKKPLRELRRTFKADKKTLSTIHSTEKLIDDLGRLQRDEFFKFFQEGQKVSKVVPKWRQLGTLPDDLLKMGEKVKKFDSFDVLAKSDTGIELEKLHLDGILERRGFKTQKDFFNYVKNPYKVKPAYLTEKIAKGNLKKIIKLQEKVENLAMKSGKLKAIDKKSIDDSYVFLEDTINKIKMEKEGLFEAISGVKLGELSGKYVPKPIYDSLQEIVRSKTAWEKNLGKVVAGFKYGKVIMNPATHGRNIISNRILNWWKLGIGPWRVDLDIKAMKQLATKGKYFQEVAPFMDEATYFSQEIGNLLLKGDGLNAIQKGKKTWTNIIKKLGDIYQGEEKYAKMVAYIAKREAGLGIDDAWKAAMSATFDYAQVTPFIRKLRTSLFGFPFITFTYKATPVAAETALKAPQRISAFGKIKQAIENQTDLKETAAERASEPSWVREGFYIKLPMKDKHGRSAYFDLTYIIPFGDLVSGDFIERQVGRETGMPGNTWVGLMKKSPFVNVITELGSNQDFYGNKIWRDSDSSEKKTGDIFRHLTKTYLPPLVADQIPGGYVAKGKYKGQRRPTTLERTQMAGEGTQYRTLMQEMLRNVGLKIQPIDSQVQDYYMESEKKKALQTLLGEKGVLSEFDIYYQ